MRKNGGGITSNNAKHQWSYNHHQLKTKYFYFCCWELIEQKTRNRRSTAKKDCLFLCMSTKKKSTFFSLSCCTVYFFSRWRKIVSATFFSLDVSVLPMHLHAFHDKKKHQQQRQTGTFFIESIKYSSRVNALYTFLMIFYVFFGFMVQTSRWKMDRTSK